MTADLADRRLMLVHAHPDDETIGTGVTMARYVDEGAAVTLVTCTLGEEGEVLVSDLSHLAAEHTDELGPHRLAELTEAMGILGVTDFVRLGGDGRFRDSGMAWDDQRRAVVRTELREGVFWTIDLLEPANELVRLIRDRRPQVLVTYDEYGLYGHPDHIQAHRVSMYAYALAGVRSHRRDLGEPWTVDRVLWTAFSAEKMREGLRAMRAQGNMDYFGGLDPEGPLPPMVTEDEYIDCEIEGSMYVKRKLAALRAHATQVPSDSEFFAGGDEFAERAWADEHYRLAAGKPFSPGAGRADDLFAGLS